MARRQIILILTGCALAASGWARRPGDPLKPGINLFSKQQDIQLGQANAQQVRQKYQVVQNPFLQDYIRRVGERLAATPEARLSGFPFSFTLLNVPQVNAFALPGGPMFIFTGLLRSTENEAQLAAVMGHEMSHVILRHGTHEATKAQGVRLVAALAGVVAGNGSTLGQLTNLGLGLGANSFILHFSREAESEADALGSHLMAEAGYNPIEMARFFEKLAGTGNQGLQFFSDHPNPGNRERAIEEELRALPQREYGYETHDFARAKAEAGSLPPAGSAERGAISPLPSQVTPAGNWQQVDRQTFQIAYPGNWKAYGDSSSPGLTLAPAGGLSRMPNGAVQMVYGMTIGYFQPAQGTASLGTATLELIARLHEQDPTLQLTSMQQGNVRVDRSEGLVQVLQSKLPSGEIQNNALVAVQRPQGIFYTLCAAPQRDFQQFAGTCDKMLGSIRFSDVNTTSPAPLP
jgi:beta-barrel assembly-enhancing protease